MVGYFYSLEEAEAVLPEVAFLIEEAIIVYQELKQEYSRALKVTESSKGTEKLLTHGFPERRKRQIKVLNDELQDIMEEIELLGGVVKDLEKGIVDFPGKFQGEDIYYCWQLGEDRINHWHYADAGMMDRKKIYRIGE